mmetsp:Transcript_57313/g.185653  ORF Transcript_57313/g.185653 Transcript_57313/m.185653 type:complete len:624 (+) Transcript_57313:465-2336(+)
MLSKKVGPVILLALMMFKDMYLSMCNIEEKLEAKLCQDPDGNKRTPPKTVVILTEAGILLLWLVLEGSRVRALDKLRKQIHCLIMDLVKSPDNYDLNFVISSLNVGTFMEVACTDTIQELTNSAFEANRLGALSKAILVHGMQQRGLRYSKSQQELLLQILRSCKGEELTDLKNYIDGSGGYLNLYKLVYEDVSNNCRDEILKYFAQEATMVRAELNTAYGIKILSDVDDTLCSSGGHYPAGCDTRFPRRTCYPGCLSLYRELDQHRESPFPSCNLIFVSARPHLYKGLTEDHSYRMFKALVAEGRMHTMPTLLPGELSNGIRAFLTAKCRGTRAWQAVGQAKCRSMMNFRSLYSEYDFIFCGDDGQGDLLAAEMIATEAELIAVKEQSTSFLLAAIIHNVLPGGSDEALAVQPRKSNEELARHSIFMHESYVGAALSLHRAHPDVLSARQLARVAEDAVRDFEDIERLLRTSGSLGSEADVQSSWTQTKKTFQADLAAADLDVKRANLPSLSRLRTPENLPDEGTPAGMLIGDPRATFAYDRCAETSPNADLELGRSSIRFGTASTEPEEDIRGGRLESVQISLERKDETPSPLQWRRAPSQRSVETEFGNWSVASESTSRC